MAKARDELRENIRTFTYNEHQSIALTDDHLDYILSQVDTYIKRIIGEDEEPGRFFGPGMPSFQRDQLRREQRQKAGLENE